MMRTFTFLLAALFCASAAGAGAPRPFPEISSPAGFVPKPGKGYILVRVPQIEGTVTVEPVLLRINSDEETQSAAAKVVADPKLYYEMFNLQSVDDAKPFAKSATEKTYLVEAKPGQYVIYGISWGAGIAGLHTCLCLGTVGFSVAPGEVTDIGYFFGDKVKQRSKIPELAAESDFGPSSDVLGGFLLGATIRPVTPASSVPTGLGWPVKPAKFHAVGKFYHPAAGGINRMVPVPGILDYDRGKVIDVQSGKVASDHL